MAQPCAVQPLDGTDPSGGFGTASKGGVSDEQPRRVALDRAKLCTRAAWRQPRGHTNWVWPKRWLDWGVANSATLFDELGGEPVLRQIVDHFVNRLFEDVMIGFMFARASRERIQAMEYEFAAEHLGAGNEYGGRPLSVAHRAHRIFDGQFDRRLTILRETLVAFEVSDRVREHWLAHTEALRGRQDFRFRRPDPPGYPPCLHGARMTDGRSRSLPKPPRKSPRWTSFVSKIWGCSFRSWSRASSTTWPNSASSSVQARETLAGRVQPGLLPAGACGVVKDAGLQVER